LIKTKWKYPQSLGTARTGFTSSEKYWMYKHPGRKEIDPLIYKANGCVKLRRTPKSQYYNQKCKSKESSRLYKLRKKNETLPIS
jgi:hypothetical protein